MTKSLSLSKSLSKSLSNSLNQIEQTWKIQWIQCIEKYTELPWDWSALSQNKNITIEHVLQHPEFWDWYELSRNSNIAMKDVLQHPELPWDWNGLSENPNITIEHVLTRSSWNWSALAWNVLLRQKPWDSIELAPTNTKITMEYINKNKNKNWNWYWLSRTVGPDFFETDRTAYFRKELAQIFSKSDLNQELMERMFHPKNINKFHDWGFEEI